MTYTKAPPEPGAWAQGQKLRKGGRTSLPRPATGNETQLSHGSEILHPSGLRDESSIELRSAVRGLELVPCLAAEVQT